MHKVYPERTNGILYLAYLKARSVLSSRGFAGLVATSVAGKINYIIRHRDLSVHKVVIVTG